MSTKSFKKNFSLIELLAVIAIMSMLIAIVGAAMKPDPMGSAAREISSVIVKARSYALAKRKYTRVHITLKEDKFAEIAPIAIYKDAACTDQTDLSATTVPGTTTNYLNKGASIESNGTALDTTGFFISFGPSGAVNSSNTTIATSGGKYSIHIINRRDPDNKAQLTINTFTGTTRFEE